MFKSKTIYWLAMCVIATLLALPATAMAAPLPAGRFPLGPPPATDFVTNFFVYVPILVLFVVEVCIIASGVNPRIEAWFINSSNAFDMAVGSPKPRKWLAVILAICFFGMFIYGADRQGRGNQFHSEERAKSLHIHEMPVPPYRTPGIDPRLIDSVKTNTIPPLLQAGFVVPYGGTPAPTEDQIFYNYLFLGTLCVLIWLFDVWLFASIYKPELEVRTKLKIRNFFQRVRSGRLWLLLPVAALFAAGCSERTARHEFPQSEQQHVQRTAFDPSLDESSIPVVDFLSTATTDDSRNPNLDKEAQAILYNNRGLIRREANDLVGALSDFNKAISLDSNFVTAYLNRAYLFELQKNFDQSIQDCTTAISLDNTNARAFGKRGDALRFKGDYDKAMADYTEAIRLDPKLAFPYGGRGYLWHKKGDNVKSEADYSKAILLNPRPSLKDRLKALRKKKVAANSATSVGGDAHE